MTHKQVKFGKGRRSRKVKQVEEEYEHGSVGRRAVLLSSDDVARMAVESSRARLINHLVSKSDDHHYPREFASYYRGPTAYLDPPYSITSHTNRVPVPNIQQVIPAYPSLVQAPRWSAYSGPSSAQNSETNFMMDFNCRCINCTSQNCPGKFACVKKFKSNIMTFCDRYTMTVNYNDAGSSRTPIPSTPKCSEVYVPCAASTVAVRDHDGKVNVHEMYARKMTPVPILKKGVVGPVFYDCVNKQLMPDHYQDEAIRDVEPLKTKSVKCFFRKDEEDCVECEAEALARKNIYNEGISDVVAVKMPLTVKKLSPPSANCSRSSVSNRYYDSDDDNYIPHSHNTESKYHRHCAKHAKREILVQEGAGQAKCQNKVAGPKVKPYPTKSCKRCKQSPRIIKLPKKVLTSEKVITSCVDKHSRSASPCGKK